MTRGNKTPSPEPWLRGSLADVPAVPRAVLHALESAREDVHKWCGGLTHAQLNARPAGIAPVTFHLRHIARSLDRLLTYAEGAALTESQIAAISTESESGATGEELLAEVDAALSRAASRVRELASADLGDRRIVGKKQLPTTLGGLLVHVADHTQRHVGQAITTAKLVASL
jgi:uncharacterized damage-inducible protein DinB